jgi:Cu-processing system permease protein
MIGASVLLGAAFIALGYVISAFARERATAAGLAIGLWLLFVVIYDLALLGALVADREGVVMTPSVFRVLLVINPADVYRLFNLGDLAGASSLTGMAGIGASAGLGAGVLLPILAAWVIVPLSLATLLFRRREA